MKQDIEFILSKELADLVMERNVGPLSDASVKRLDQITKIAKTLDLLTEKQDDADLSSVTDEELEMTASSSSPSEAEE